MRNSPVLPRKIMPAVLLFALSLACAPFAFADADGDLLAAAEKGDISETVDALKQGADPDTYDEGDKEQNTALSLAVRSKSIKVVRALLKKGADPSLYYRDGNCPVMLAAQSGDQEILKALLEAGGKGTFVVPTRSPVDLAQARMAGGGFYVFYDMFKPGMATSLEKSLSVPGAAVTLDMATMGAGIRFGGRDVRISGEYLMSTGSSPVNWAGKRSTLNLSYSEVCMVLEVPFNKPFTGALGPVQVFMVIPEGLGWSSLRGLASDYYAFAVTVGLGFGLRLCTRSFFSLDARFAGKTSFPSSGFSRAGKSITKNDGYLRDLAGSPVSSWSGGWETRVEATAYLW